MMTVRTCRWRWDKTIYVSACLLRVVIYNLVVSVLYVLNADRPRTRLLLTIYFGKGKMSTEINKHMMPHESIRLYDFLFNFILQITAFVNNCTHPSFRMLQ